MLNGPFVLGKTIYSSLSTFLKLRPLNNYRDLAYWRHSRQYICNPWIPIAPEKWPIWAYGGCLIYVKNLMPALLCQDSVDVHPSCHRAQGWHWWQNLPAECIYRPPSPRQGDFFSIKDASNYTSTLADPEVVTGDFSTLGIRWSLFTFPNCCSLFCWYSSGRIDAALSRREKKSK